MRGASNLLSKGNLFFQASSDEMERADVWPLFDLRIKTPRLVLATAQEPDVCELAARLPADLELDPSLPLHEGFPAQQQRAMTELQQYWNRLGSWTRESWNLPFAIKLDGDLVGIQTLEADHFAERRGVETASWLAPEVRRRGLGKEMRAAVLYLAFDELGAQFAESGAWHDNDASLGVSRSLGYELNGYEIKLAGKRVGRMPRLLLTAEQWRRVDRPRMSVHGVNPCLPLFGL